MFKSDFLKKSEPLRQRLADIVAAQLEPSFGGLVVRAGLGQALPKPVGMVQVIQVNQFVQNHIVPDKGRHLYQAPVQ